MTQTDKLREKINQIFDGCYSQDGSTCLNHSTFQRGKAVNELLDNFIEFLEKELGYVRKDDDQSLPESPYTYYSKAKRNTDETCDSYCDIGYSRALSDMLDVHWVKVKEKSNE